MLAIKSCDEICESLESLSTGDLKDRLSEAFKATVEGIMEIASIVKILETRGEDLDSLKIGMLAWFRRVAYGQVSPNILIQYGDRPSLLRKLANLPMPDQVKIANDEPVEVLSFSNGRASERWVSPSDMTKKEVEQVFGSGRIRGLSEQRGWIDQKKPKFHSTETATPEVRIDKKKKQLVITGATKISRSQLFSYLSQMGD